MGASFAVAFVGIGFGLIWLSLYVFGLFSLGRKLAERYRLRVNVNSAGVFFGILALGMSLPPAFVVPLHPVLKFGVFVCLWILHAPSVFLGYWYSYDKRKQEDIDKWKSNTDSWLQEWEESQSANLLLDDED